MSKNRSKSGDKKGRLRCGFSTGTAAAAAAKAALRRLINGVSPTAVAVRLPSGAYLAVPVADSGLEGKVACASVIKNGGDDPDITNGAEIRAKVSILPHVPGQSSQNRGGGCALSVIAGKGVGLVTKPGLPIAVGEPAINPVPRQMLSENLTLELLLSEAFDPEALSNTCSATQPTESPAKPIIFLPFPSSLPKGWQGKIFRKMDGFSIVVEIEVPKGEELARHTLNPRLGIQAGISILGTTGIVKPFSNEAYEETIHAALSVAASNRCGPIVLSTGGKSEKFAREKLPEIPIEGFVQIADFFSFAVREARRFGFCRIIHSVFFGKAVKMAQGHLYTHAHSVPLELDLLARIANSLGYGDAHCRELSSANTARHAMEIIARAGSQDIVQAVAEKAAEQSALIAGDGSDIRLLLFDYDGRLLADVK